MEEIERRYTLRVLERVNGNKRAAAQILGYDRRTLHRRLSRWRAEQGEAEPEDDETESEAGGETPGPVPPGEECA